MQTPDSHPGLHQAPDAAAEPAAGPERLPGIRHLIAVASGKGGVGKSTVSVNLALALQQFGGQIGLVDADVFGPSIPVMLGLPTGQQPEATPDQKLIPPAPYGLKVISMGMLRGDDHPAILRGPMVGKFLSTFTCPHCGKDTDVFRSGGGERMSEQLGVPFLGAIPLDADIVTGGDEGRPMLLDKPNSVAAQAYQAIATALADQLQGLPTMVV